MGESALATFGDVETTSNTSSTTRKGRAGQVVLAGGLLMALIAVSACSQGKDSAGAPAKATAPGVAIAEAPDATDDLNPNGYPIFDGTPDEFTVALANCLTTKGWKTVIREWEEGSIGFEIPGLTEEQNDEFMAADRACRSEIGIIDPTPDPKTMRAHFRHMLWAKECLEDLGYDISDPPSVEVHLESLGAAWSPHEDLSHLSRGAWNAANRACPQDAATRERLLGSE